MSGCGGGPRSGAVGGAQRSGPPLRGIDSGAQPAEPRVRPIVIVIGTPVVEHDTSVLQRPEQGLVEQLVSQAADEGFGKRILHRLARRDVVPLDLASSVHRRIAFEVNSVPLSLTMVLGFPYATRSGLTTRYR